MKAIIPALFFATLAAPSGFVSAVLLAALVFWVAYDQGSETRMAC